MLEKPFNNKADEFYLSKYEQNGKEYICHYIIARDAKSFKIKQ